jgi:hypothetical protein
MLQSIKSAAMLHSPRPDFVWDLVFLDEGHKIKDSGSITAKNAALLPARHRFILSGTPIQNRLHEMWALFDFACQGQLLGDAAAFRTTFETPIVQGTDRNASLMQRHTGNEVEYPACLFFDVVSALFGRGRCSSACGSSLRRTFCGARRRRRSRWWPGRLYL